MSNKKVLFITRHDPFSVGGGSYASMAFLKAFSDIYNGYVDVFLAESCNITSLNPNNRYIKVPKRSFIKKVYGLFTGKIHRFNPFVINYLEKNHQYFKYSLCIFDGSIVAGDLVQYMKKKGIPTITIHHNFEIDFHKTSKHKDLIWLLNLIHIKNNESNAYKKCDLNLYISEKDKNKMESAYNRIQKGYVIGCFERNKITRNIIDESITIKKENSKSSISLVISGTLASPQTEDGILYFLKQIWPSIDSLYNIKLIITGRAPSDRIRTLCQKWTNITLTENPTDIDVIIQNGDIYVSPVKVGSGLKLRLMDGLKNGLPILSHEVSAYGYEYFQDYNWFKTFTSPDDFGSGLKEMIDLLEKKNINRKEIMCAYENYFSFDNGTNRIKDILLKEKLI